MTEDQGSPQLLASFHQSVADGDIDHAVRRLIDLAHDRAPQTLNEVLVISSSLARHKKQVLAVGSSPQLEADGNALILRLLELASAVAVEIAKTLSIRGETEAGQSLPPPKPPRALTGEVAVRSGHLTKQRRKANPSFTLRDISLEVRVGEILAVVGPNGHGKSTLLAILAGCLEHDSGALEYPALCEGPLYWPRVKRNIGYVPQSVATLSQQSTSPKENAGQDGHEIERSLRFTAALYGARDEASNDQAIEYILLRLGLNDYRNATFGSLSGGYRARFDLARALLKKPKLLILDEPLAHLDKNVQLRFLQDVRELSISARHPFACIMSSQHLYEIEAISDSTLFLSNGRSEYYGSTSNIGADSLTQTYELACDASKDEVSTLLSDLEVQVNRAGPFLTLIIPKSIPWVTVLQRLSAHHDVTYLRNIGRSSRIFFRPE